MCFMPTRARFAIVTLSFVAVFKFQLSAGDGDGMEAGAAIYRDYCAVCHQANGEGLESLIPPLGGSEFVTQDAREVVKVIGGGRGAMPAFKSGLDPGQIAEVTSYIRAMWGEGASPVTPEVVREVLETIDLREAAVREDDI